MFTKYTPQTSNYVLSWEYISITTFLATKPVWPHPDDVCSSHILADMLQFQP
jgi:hypothetical protein